MSKSVVSASKDGIVGEMPGELDYISSPYSLGKNFIFRFLLYGSTSQIAKTLLWQRGRVLRTVFFFFFIPFPNGVDTAGRLSPGPPPLGYCLSIIIRFEFYNIRRTRVRFLGERLDELMPSDGSGMTKVRKSMSIIFI
jgi:hypothetical protein